MELWIRSQDKMALAKFDLCILEKYDDKYMFIADHYRNMGTYKTKERALEILDELQNILKPKYILDSSSIKPDGDSWVENGVILQNYNANAKIEELSTYVYEMPKE